MLSSTSGVALRRIEGEDRVMTKRSSKTGRFLKNVKRVAATHKKRMATKKRLIGSAVLGYYTGGRVKYPKKG